LADKEYGLKLCKSQNGAKPKEKKALKEAVELFRKKSSFKLTEKYPSRMMADNFKGLTISFLKELC
jgi:hypothetical protein